MNSPKPPSEEESDNELLQAYRSTSARDRRLPNPEVRHAILEQAARVATARRRSRRQPHFDWRWKAAASIAVVGLVGVLTLQNLRSPLESAAPTPSAGNAGTSVTAANPPEAAPAQDRATQASKESARLEEIIVTAHRRTNQHEATTAPPVARAEDAVPLEAPQLRLQEPLARMAPATPASPPLPSSLPAPSAAVSGAGTARARARSPADSEELSRYWLDKVIAAVHLRYPELFSDTPVDTDAVRSGVRHEIRIALVLNGDGTVYKSALEGAADAQNSDPSTRLHAEFGVKPEQLAVPAQTYYLDRTREAPGDIVVTLGVLRGDPSNAQEPDQ